MPAGLIQPRASGSDISPDGKIITAGQQQDDSVVIPSSNNDSDQTVSTQQQDSQVDNQQVEPDIDFDAFAAAKGLKIEDKPEPKKDDVAKADDAEPDDKKVDLAPQQQKVDSQEDLDKPQPQVQPKQQRQDVDKRDFTGIAPELVPHFKRMGNDAFNALKPLFLAKDEEIKKRDIEISNLKQGKVIVPDSYYEHERAFTLTPEYERAALAANEAQVVYNHWMQQLNDVRQGSKTFKTLTRDANGNLAYGKDMPADAAAEVNLLSLFQSSHNQLMTYNGKLAAVQEGYKGNYNQAKQWVEGMNSNTFTAFKDEKSVLSVAAKEYVEKTLPAVFRTNPLAPLLAKSLVTTNEMYKMLLSAKQMLEAGGKLPAAGGGGNKQAKAASRQPTNNDINSDSSGGAGGSSEVSMDDFNRVKGLV